VAMQPRKGAGEQRGAGAFDLQDMHAQRVNDDVGPRRGRRMGIGVYGWGAIVLFEEERQKIEFTRGWRGLGMVWCVEGEWPERVY
jgi:hypothetical protein